MSVAQVSEARRGERILAAVGGAAPEPSVPRELAASPLAFHRGSARLLYADLAAGEGPGRTAPRTGGATGAGGGAADGRRAEGPYLDERTARVWIHGDLHAGSFGSHLDARGRLVFHAAGFTEATVGPFTWDLHRLVGSLALTCRAKALSDPQATAVVTAFATAYRERIRALAAGPGGDGAAPLTADTAEGPVLATLRAARSGTRWELLDSLTEIWGAERRFAPGADTVELDAATRYTVLDAFDGYLETLPPAALERPESYRVKDVTGRRTPGGGPLAYDILLEGASDALESDVVIRITAARPSAARHGGARRMDSFRHEGHRAVAARRALQAHADPWLGWTELEGTGRIVAEVSPYAVPLDWSRPGGPEAVGALAGDLGRVTATMHAAAEDAVGHAEPVPFSTERAIDAAIAADEDGFVPFLTGAAQHWADRAHADHRLLTGLFRGGRIPGL